MVEWARRIATVAVCAPVAVALLWTDAGGLALLAALALACAVEFRRNLLPRLVGKSGAPPGLELYTLLPCLLAWWGARAAVLGVLVGMAAVCVAHVAAGGARARAVALDAGFGPAFLGGSFAAMVLLGPEWRLMCALPVWNADNLGVLVGATAGRTPLAPRVSPNKTVEGSLAALAGAAATGWLVDGRSWWGLRVGLLLGVCAVGGDLAVSVVKRAAGVKDTGRFFPGHGGCLDRMDSMTVAAGVLYVLVGP